MQETVGVDVAEPRPHRLIDEEEVCKLMPRSVVVAQRVVIAQPVRPHLHQGSVHGAAAGAAIEPDHGTLAVRNVTILKMPEEEMAVVLGVYFYVPVARVRVTRRQAEDRVAAATRTQHASSARARPVRRVKSGRSNPTPSTPP